LINQSQFLAQLVQTLRQSSITFMVSGSIASSLLGKPRATNDIDIVIDANQDAIDRFLQMLPAEWYASQEAAHAAIMNRSMFNVIDPASGFKADLIVRKERPFSIEEFRRRREGIVLGCAVVLVTPEDSILSKLEWSKDTESRRHYEDAVNIAEIKHDLDRDYLRKWALELGISEKLATLLDEADRLRSNAGN
jgi:hypothetical protein